MKKAIRTLLALGAGFGAIGCAGAGVERIAGGEGAKLADMADDLINRAGICSSAGNGEAAFDNGAAVFEAPAEGGGKCKVELTYRFKSPEVVNAIRIRSGAGGESAPREFTVRARDWGVDDWEHDRENWVEVGTAKGETGWGSGEDRYFAVGNTKPYREYGIVFTGNNGGARLEVEEVGLLNRDLELTGVAAPKETGVGLEPLAPGAVKPLGWLRDWCVTARNGYVGRLDEIDRHFRIAWTTNCMKRGKMLRWHDAEEGSWSLEGGGYWFDGLVRLAWQLEDEDLKAYARKRLETVLERMHPNSVVLLHWMDRRDPAQVEEALKYGFSVWGSALLGRALCGYYHASGDERALRALNCGFNDARWFNGGNSQVVPATAWETYKLGGDEAVGRALDEWCAAGPKWEHRPWRYARRPGGMNFRKFSFKEFNWDWLLQHGVAMHETMVSALRMSRWRTGRKEWGDATYEWMEHLRRHCLQPSGVLVADESAGYTGGDRGTETCVVAGTVRLNLEMMRHSGHGKFGDRAERALFNAGAACTTADFFRHVYVQTPNRTVIEDRPDFTCPVTARYYLRKNWPLCCTAALTRYVPDFVQHLWMETADGGLAAAMYSPCRVDAKAGGVKTRVEVETDYPFGEAVKIKVEPEEAVEFALRLRMPEWCGRPEIRVNGEAVAAEKAAGFAAVKRRWGRGDVVELKLPMKPVVETGRDRNKSEAGEPWCAVTCGPLLYALNLPGKDGEGNILKDGVRTDYRLDAKAVAAEAKLERGAMPAKWSWCADCTPVRVSVPFEGGDLKLVPYGMAPLRISMFGVE